MAKNKEQKIENNQQLVSRAQGAFFYNNALSAEQTFFEKLLEIATEVVGPVLAKPAVVFAGALALLVAAAHARPSSTPSLTATPTFTPLPAHHPVKDLLSNSNFWFFVLGFSIALFLFAAVYLGYKGFQHTRTAFCGPPEADPETLSLN